MPPPHRNETPRLIKKWESILREATRADAMIGYTLVKQLKSYRRALRRSLREKP